MRIVIVGTGAIGGAVAAALHRAQQDVVAVSRGAQLEAIRAKGLRLRAPDLDEVVRFPVVGSIADVGFGPDDLILLAIKGQDTEDAVEDLRAAGVTSQPIFCLQNGVANETKALRRFPNVHGVTVMMPAMFTVPGEVVVQSAPKLGLFYVGRFPGGSDKADEALCEALNKAGIAAFVKEDVMSSKYGKLLMNLSNIVGAALGHGAEAPELRKRMMDEGKAVYSAAGIAWEDVGMNHPDRTAYMNFTKVPGIENYGTSTAQSFLRGTSRVETDWLNGEIVWLGRLHGVPVPVNAALTRIAARMARDGVAPGSLSVEEIEAEIQLS
ncbi:MAG: 2-dehydropantoate 2-reductase [Pseudomonadota bacterium]|nr:2-dehydropantoate 2-reductase [Pseudomonadota bacterium]